MTAADWVASPVTFMSEANLTASNQMSKPEDEKALQATHQVVILARCSASCTTFGPLAWPEAADYV